jgi:hypothetical protein
MTSGGNVIGRLDYGDAPTWLASIFTGLAVLGAYRLLNTQQDELRAAQEDRRANEDDRRRDQARFVSAWCDGVTGPDAGGDLTKKSTWQRHSVFVHYRNGSEEPVFNARVTVKSHWGATPNDIQSEHLHILAPRSEGDVRLEVVLPPDEVLGMPRPFPPVEMSFTDARGRSWIRSDQGELNQMEED